MRGLDCRGVFTFSYVKSMKEQEKDQARWFVDVVLPHEKDLRNWLGLRFPSIRDVDDLVQEAFTRLINAHNSGPVANPRAYLFVISRNLAIDQLRHSSYERPSGAVELDPLSIVDELTSPPESIALKEELKLLIEAIQLLPERCRQVMTLRKVYGLSQKEVAKRLNISVHTVEAQIGIGLDKCAVYFRRHGYSTR